MAEKKKYLKPEDVEREYEIPRNTLKHWRWLKKGPRYLMVGGRVRYRRDQLEAWLDSKPVLTLDDRSRWPN